MDRHEKSPIIFIVLFVLFLLAFRKLGLRSITPNDMSSALSVAQTVWPSGDRNLYRRGEDKSATNGNPNRFFNAIHSQLR